MMGLDYATGGSMTVAGKKLVVIEKDDQGKPDVGKSLLAMAAYKNFPGMEGSTYYYFGIPKNPVNEWLVANHYTKFKSPPDFFTADGMSAAITVVEEDRILGSSGLFVGDLRSS